MEITKAVVAEVMRAYNPEVIVDYTLEPLAKEGDNYNCTLQTLTVHWRAAGDTETRESVFAAKCTPKNDMLRQFHMKTGVVRAECDFYSRLLPALEKYQPGIREKATIPKCLYSSGQDGLLIMEHLKKQNFDLTPRGTPLSTEQIVLVLKKIAAFHGLSYLAIEKGLGLEKFSQEFPAFAEELYPPENNLFWQEKYDELMSSVFGQVQAILRAENDASLQEKISRFSRDRNCLMNRIHRPKEGGFNCLVHNDAWRNNMMFRSDDEDAIRIVDYQLVRRVRPSIDIAYFFASSIEPERLEKQKMSFLKTYHDELVRNLGDAAVKYPLDAFLADYADCRPYWLCMALFHSQIALAPFNPASLISEKKEENSATNLQKQQESFWEQQAATNQTLKKRVKALLSSQDALDILM